MYPCGIHVYIYNKNNGLTFGLNPPAAVSVDSITAKSEEKGVASLFTKGGTVLSATSSQGIEDFMVVSYLILTEADHG